MTRKCDTQPQLSCHFHHWQDEPLIVWWKNCICHKNMETDSVFLPHIWVSEISIEITSEVHSLTTLCISVTVSPRLQSFPPNPTGQSQEKVSQLTRHVPPFWHGFDLQKGNLALQPYEDTKL